MLSLISDDKATRLLPIADIRRDGGTQPRDGINQLHVADMRIALQQDKPLPAVEVIYDGESYWLWDGFHRIEAHIAEERTVIAANVRQGTLQDAQWESYSVNAGHGLKRSNADKERQVRNALRHPKAQGMSNVQIAKHVGVDDKTVRRYRAEMEAASEIPSLTSRQGADGKSYPASAPRPSKPPPPTRYPIPDELAAAGYVVEDHPAGGFGVIRVHERGNVSYPRVWSLEEAIAQIRARMAPPALRTLTLDETIAVVWRVVKYALPHPPDAEPLAKWTAYRAHVARSATVSRYTHILTDGVQLDEDILTRARTQIMAELDGNIEHHRRTHQRAGAQPAAPPPRRPQFTAAMANDGWELRQVVATGQWWAYNTQHKRSTATYADPNDAISAAYDKQFDKAPRPEGTRTEPAPDAKRMLDLVWELLDGCMGYYGETIWFDEETTAHERLAEIEMECGFGSTLAARLEEE